MPNVPARYVGIAFRGCVTTWIPKGILAVEHAPAHLCNVSQLRMLISSNNFSRANAYSPRVSRKCFADRANTDLVVPKRKI